MEMSYCLLTTVLICYLPRIKRKRSQFSPTTAIPVTVAIKTRRSMMNIFHNIHRLMSLACFLYTLIFDFMPK